MKQIAISLVLMLLTGCVSYKVPQMVHDYSVAPIPPDGILLHPRAMSYDQENLSIQSRKDMSDGVCPIGIFNAPGGNLEECW